MHKSDVQSVNGLPRDIMASPVSMTSDEEKDWVDGVAASYDFVRFTLSDMHGISRCKLVPRRHVDDKLKTGITAGAGIVGYEEHCLLILGNGRNRTTLNRSNDSKTFAVGIVTHRRVFPAQCYVLCRLCCRKVSVCLSVPQSARLSRTAIVSPH